MDFGCVLEVFYPPQPPFQRGGKNSSIALGNREKSFAIALLLFGFFSLSVCSLLSSPAPSCPLPYKSLPLVPPLTNYSLFPPPYKSLPLVPPLQRGARGDAWRSHLHPDRAFHIPPYLTSLPTALSLDIAPTQSAPFASALILVFRVETGAFGFSPLSIYAYLFREDLLMAIAKVGGLISICAYQFSWKSYSLIFFYLFKE